MAYDELWPGGPKFIQDSAAFSLGTDAVLLSDFALKGTANRACDLGSGAGVISILLAWHSPRLTVDGVELQPAACEAARENIRLCGLEDRISVLKGDLRRHRDFLEAGAYDLVVSNPPYFPAGSGKASASDAAATARAERTCTLGDVCAAAAFLTRWGGRFALVHKPERLAEIFRVLSENCFEPKRLRFVHHKARLAPNLVLIESRRGGRPALTIEPPLILTEDDSGDTEEAKRIYHRT